MAEQTALHPMCPKCGWRKGGRDSWNGAACKCGETAPAMPTEGAQVIPITRPKSGDERWLVEMIHAANVKAAALKGGWDGTGDDMREFCEPQDAAHHTTHTSLDAATTAAKASVTSGQEFYGCTLILHQVFGAAQWRTTQMYEVAGDGERIEVNA